MIACPHCGTANADGVPACAACGTAFWPPPAHPQAAFGRTVAGMAPTPMQPPTAPQAQPRQFGGTMVGVGAQAPPGPQPRQFGGTMVGVGAQAPVPSAASQAPQQYAPTTQAPQQGARAGAPGLKQTMLGMAPNPAPVAAPLAAPSSPPNQGVGASFKQTMLGMVPSVAPAAPPNAWSPQQQFATPPNTQFAPPGAPPVAAPAAPHVAAPSQAPQAAMFRGTMVAGSATPGAVGGEVGRQEPVPVSPAIPLTPNPPSASAPMASGPPPSSVFNAKRTMQGVATPGIAPIHGGAAPAPDVQPQMVAPRKRRRPPRVVAPAKIPRSAWILMAIAAFLLVGAGVFALVWRAPRPIAAEVIADDKGRELVRLTCDNCPDGTTAHAGTATAIFNGQHAAFAPVSALRVGANQLDVEIERPGFGRDEKLTVVAPLDYRINGDFSALSETPPKLRVVVEATPRAAVVIDGHAVSLDASGKAAREFDVSSELEGTADETATLERSIPYTVTPHDGRPQSGNVVLKLGIVPLRIDAPGHRIIIESEQFMLTGHTMKDGTIAVEGRSITVDGDGRFAQLMNVSSVGATTITVRASAKDYAPRIARVEVKRVTSLKDEAEALRKAAIQAYSRVAADIEGHKGAQVAFAGHVVESRVDNHVTIALLEIDSGCEHAPCLARLIHGAALELAAEQKVSVFGEVTRAVDGPRSGLRIPEIAAAFVMSDAK